MYRLCTLQSPLQVSNITLSIFFYDDNVSNTKVSQWCFPFFPVLKSSKKFLSPTTPKLVTDVLYPPPSLSGIKVGVRNTPCGGITTFDFMVSMWLGDKAAWLLASLIVSTTNGLVLTIPSTSTNNILSDSSSRLAPCVFMRDESVFLADRICFSHTPPVWLANGGFLFHWIQSALFCNMNSPTFFWLTSFQHLASSLSLLPQSCFRYYIELFLYYHVYQ